MAKPISTAHYSLRWAESIVQKVEDKYARGYSFTKEILALEDKDLAMYLARGDPLWPKLRNLARFLQACADGGWNSAKMVQELYQSRVYGKEERIIKRLDELGFRRES